MANHAGTTAHRAFLHRAAFGLVQSLAHMLWAHVLAPDIVEQAIVGFHDHRHAPVHRRVRQALALQGDQAVAHHPDTVGVGNGHRRGQQPRLADPFKPRGVAIAVEHVVAGKTRLMPRFPGTWLDQRNAGAHLLAVDLRLERGMADANPGNIGDGIQFAGHAQPQRNAQLTCTHTHSLQFLKRRTQPATDAIQNHRQGQQADDDHDVAYRGLQDQGD